MVYCATRSEVGRERKEKIKTLVERLAIQLGDFTLSSGQKSKYYFDGKMVLTDPEAATLIAQDIFDELNGLRVEAVGGLSFGAALMGPAISVVSQLAGKPLPCFVVREEQKGHGTKKSIEGGLPATKGARVAVIDDVITAGGSVFKAIEKVEEAGCEVVKVIVLLDRHQGGSDRVKERYDFVAILHADSNGRVTVDEPKSVSGDAREGALSR